MEVSAGKIWGLRRMADMNGRFKMIAVDQRPPIKNFIKEKLDTKEAPWQEVAGFKKLLIENLQSEGSAMLLDPHYAYPAGISVFNPEKGLIVTLEDSMFTENEHGRQSREIDDWSVEKIKRVGGDAVKVLIWYRPDSAETIRLAQQDFAKRTGEACMRFDIPFLLELLVYPLSSDDNQSQDYIEMHGKNTDHVLESVNTFSNSEFCVDVFKLESPVEANLVPSKGSKNWEEVQKLYKELGRIANRPWVMLSAGAKKEEFVNIISHAYEAGASGYLAGRAIWNDEFQHYPNWQNVSNGLKEKSISYMRKLNEITDNLALPWHKHPNIKPSLDKAQDNGNFRHLYKDFGYHTTQVRQKAPF